MNKSMLWIVAIGGFALACADTDRTSERAEVTGTAMYRERIMLPPIAVFEATLEDASRMDAPSIVLGQTTVEGELIFTTDASYPVLTRGAGSTVELLLKRVSR